MATGRLKCTGTKTICVCVCGGDPLELCVCVGGGGDPLELCVCRDGAFGH